MFNYIIYLDYSDYFHESQAIENLKQQNKMLPIYCSIMGLIIFILLGYVIYKLWKQRTTMTSAKLNDTFGGLDTGINSFITISPCDSSKHQSSKSLNTEIKHNLIKKIDCQNMHFLEINQECQPLISNNDQIKQNSMFT